MIGRLNHVAIAVADLDAATAVYRDTLGATVSAPVDLPEHGVRVIHAGLVPGVAIEDQDPKHLVSMRNMHEGEPTKRIDRGVAWASLYEGPEHVLFGHDAIRKLQRFPHATGLDTGCCYGGELTGMLLPERALVSVPARQVWQAPGQEE